MTETNPAKFRKLVDLLRTLFQLDRPELDFGIYRILHARAGEVTQFLERDLLPQVKKAFAQYQSADSAELRRELTELEATLRRVKVDPDTNEEVLKLRERLLGAVDIGALENEVYDHLHSFFRRYYSEGDFLAKRVYKPGVYAIPYEGEEVTLHWANKDQYYIKTSEYLRDYAFRLRPEAGEGEDPMRVHFRLVDVTEGEHGNVKAADSRNRVFVLTSEDFIAQRNGELELRFEYRPATLEDWPADQRDGKKKPPAQRELIALAVERILAVQGDFTDWLAQLGRPHVKADSEVADYTRLEAHLRRYSACNTFDYFIHKDLDGFLRSELDFYIKNEVMHLDDVENETAPRVEQYLSKIKVIRRIAGKVIDFLAQLENFQKKLWLKKKFVFGSDWLVAISQVPDELLSEVCANVMQLDEWKKLHSLNELPQLARPDYSEPLTPAYLQSHPTLMVDTRYFDPAFVARLLESIRDIDDTTDGVLVHSENFQAHRLIRQRYRERAKCIYIDPPYNTEQDRATGKFLYKDSYARSSWLALISSRLEQLRELTAEHGVLFASIDEHEVHRLLETAQDIFRDRIGLFTWVKKKKGSHLSRTVRDMTEYVVAVSPDKSRVELFGENAYSNKAQPLAKRTNKPKELVFPARTVRTTLPNDTYEPGVYGTGTSALTFMSSFRVSERLVTTQLHVTGPFVWTQSTLDDELASGSEVHLSKKFGFNVFRSGQEDRVKRPSTLLDAGSGIGTNEDASAELIDIFGEEGIASYPKPTSLVAYLVRACSLDAGQCVIDSFAGSGTTGHAVIQLNREDETRRHFLLVEMGHYFDTVLVSRIKKVAFAPEWKNGSPQRLATQEEAEFSPRLIKILRLESYEDALNNLTLSRSTQLQAAIDFTAGNEKGDGLREQYLLRYQLDVESRGSASMLDIRAFSDPIAYMLRVKTPGSDESREVNVDLLETFNWLLGLTVQHIAAPRSFTAEFERDSEDRLQLKGRLKQDANGPWWFRTVTGTTPEGRRTLVIWRKLTGDPEQDNLVLDTWFRDKQAFSVRDTEFDLIYVNGDSTLENQRLPDESWKVRLIEEDFQRLMFEGTD